MRGTSRIVAAGVLVVVALLLQVTVLPGLGWPDACVGAVPGVVLLTVVATALATDTRFAMLTGFFAGLLLDLAPPTHHVAGRWALALLVVGYVVGRLSHDNESEVARRDRPGVALVAAAALGGSFVGNSVFALSGMVLGDLGLSTSQVLRVIGIGMAWDLIAAAAVVPAVLFTYRRMAQVGEPARISRITAR